MPNTLSKIINKGVLALVFLLPLFFLTITADIFFFNKLALLVGGVLILTAICIIDSLLKRRVSLTISLFDLPVVAMAVASLLSFFLRAPNRSAALLGETGIILTLTLLYFLITHRIRERKLILTALTISGSLLALVAIYQFIGVGQAFFKDSLFEAKSFTPTGSLLTLATFLVATLIVSIRSALTRRQPLTKTLLFVGSGLQVAGLILTVYQMMPNQVAALRLLPISAGWSIAIDAFKQSPLFGVGPNNFLSAFTQNKPLSLNFGSLWGIRFLQSSNYPLHLLTTTGLLGFASWIFLALSFMKNFKELSRSTYGKTLSLVVAAMLVLQLMLPANILTLFTLYLALGLLASRRSQTSEFQIPNNQTLNWISGGATALLVGLCLFPLYPLGRAYAAEYYFRQSLKAIQNNDGGATYNFQVKAMGYNPKHTGLRIAFSQTNLALAQSLSAQENPSDQDQQNIIQLVQQAIEEAKNAVAINPQNIVAWENLAQTYRNLINFAQGADQWAISALTQAVQLDPGNPELRIQLGGLYYALKDYDSAQRVFEQAIAVKSDHANAYYNLAVTLQDQNKLQKAALAYRQTLNLLPADSPDRAVVEEKLAPIEEEFKKAQEAAQAQAQQGQSQQGGLTEPQPVPQKPSGFEPIILEEKEAAPPEPSPTPSPTPEPEPTIEEEPTPTPEEETPEE